MFETINLRQQKMEKIKNFDIVINKCLWDIKPTSETLDLDKNDFLLIMILKI